MKRIYLASAYSGTPEEQEQRFRAVCRAAGHLIRSGHCVYSPIAHSHPIATECPDIGLDWKAWEKIDMAFLDWADEVWVLMLPGWAKSRGVKAEMEAANKVGKKVILIHEPAIPQQKGETHE